MPKTIELPCDVGDTLKWNYGGHTFYSKVSCIRVTVGIQIITINCYTVSGSIFCPHQFGKTVFIVDGEEGETE